MSQPINNECVVGVYQSLDHAEQAVHILQRAGFPREQISLVVSGLDDPELIAELKMGDDSARDAKIGAAMGGLFGLLGGAAIATTFGAGTVFLAGPIAGALVGTGVGTFVGGMAGWGVHDVGIRHYEKAIQEGKALVIAHGDPLALDQAERILRETDVAELHMHARSSTDSPEVVDT